MGSKSSINKEESPLRPFIEPSSNILSVLYGNNTHYIRSEYLVLIDYLLRRNTNINNLSQFEEIKSLSNLLDIILRKYHAKILYIIFKITFSSKHFLKKRASLRNHDWVDRLFSDLEAYSIIRKIKRSDEDYNIIINFWRLEFKNTIKKKDVDLYCISPDFLPVISAFSSIIERKFFSLSEIHTLQQFKKSYDRYSSIVKSRIDNMKEINKNKLGNCIECNRVILKSEKQGKGGYHIFNAGLVCDRCKITLLTIKGREWIRKNN